MSLGSRIRALRKSQQLTQAELAQKAALTRVAICRIESATSICLKASTLLKICTALGTDVTHLLTE
jgi:transcriptional regulator with XRE-family HTH domain